MNEPLNDSTKLKLLTLANLATTTPVSEIHALQVELKELRPELVITIPNNKFFGTALVMGPHDFRREVRRTVYFKSSGVNHLIAVNDVDKPRSVGVECWGASSAAKLISREYEEHLENRIEPTKKETTPVETAFASTPATSTSDDWYTDVATQVAKMRSMSQEEAVDFLGSAMPQVDATSDMETAKAVLWRNWARVVRMMGGPAWVDPPLRTQATKLAEELVSTAKVMLTFEKLVSWLSAGPRTSLSIPSPQALVFLVEQLLVFAGWRFAEQRAEPGSKNSFTLTEGSQFSLTAIEFSQLIADALSGPPLTVDAFTPGYSPVSMLPDPIEKPKVLEKPKVKAAPRVRSKIRPQPAGANSGLSGLSIPTRPAMGVVDGLHVSVPKLVPSTRADSEWISYYAHVEEVDLESTARKAFNRQLWADHMGKVTNHLVEVQYLSSSGAMRTEQGRVAYVTDELLVMQHAVAIDLGLLKSIIVLDPRAARTRRRGWLSAVYNRMDVFVKFTLNEPRPTVEEDQAKLRSASGGCMAFGHWLGWSIEERLRAAQHWRAVLAPFTGKGKHVRLFSHSAKGKKAPSRTAHGTLRLPRATALKDEAVVADVKTGDNVNVHLGYVHRVSVCFK